MTAIIQPGTNWQIFSYGFAIIFLINQIYDTPIPKRHPWILASLYALFSVAVALGFQQNRAYYKMLFVPVALFISLFACIGIGMLTALLLRKLERISSFYYLQRIIVTLVYIRLASGITISLAIILAGDLKVYNDY